ncbi:MAG: class I SAM-dependent methyltransferase [Deltaproteobacteria bacterium]|nr:class I SAM-dependent methyltransferase [Kofleriaceae bacterium]
MSETGWPERFWGPETLDPAAWAELTPLLDTREEIEALVGALVGVASIADVGGGTGLLTRALAARVAPVVVVEPSAAQRAVLDGVREARIRCVAGRAERVPLGEGAVDAAMATWVLQYTEDPVQAVRELARVARTRVVIVQAAARNDLVDVYNEEAQVAGLACAHHGWLLARAREVLEERGFAVESSVVPTPVAAPPGGAAQLAEVLARLHFAGHPEVGEMRRATEGMIAARLAAGGGALRDDGEMLVGTRPSTRPR